MHMIKKYNRIKNEPINCKYQGMRLIKVSIFLSVIFIGCNSSKGVRKNANDFKCEILDSKVKSECEILHVLSDTLIWKNGHLKVECVKDAVFDIFKKTNMTPYRYCSFTGCDYYSYSLDKSIFKIDLFRLMLFYKCPDTILLKSNLKGNFTEAEVAIIKESHYGRNPIDTSILW